ncbi:tRNA wybutosine-synthesizing protein 4 [Lepisosteus oculatus]|uniref:tRNA wybutosine-synthesizing protein 4 n=1 Tax=Lepisosteus oculatus TaxID=7918 RepID=UPI0035F51C86
MPGGDGAVARGAERRKRQVARDVAVQGTNDSSVVSKVSAAMQGYFPDPFLKSFVCRSVRRAPLINRGYYVRWKAVDHCVREFLRGTAGSTRRQVLSLGAGFDSLYFRLHSAGALEGCVVFELDFPDVSRRKAGLVAASPSLMGAVQSPTPPLQPVCLYSEQYRLLGADLRELRGVESALMGAGLDPTAPTLLLSEVVLTYMETERSNALIGWAAGLLPHAVFVMYEQLRPHDPFGRVMQEHFRRLSSALHALSEYPDTEAQRRRFLDRGWEHCVCLDMNHFYLGQLGPGERQRVEALEPFDEFEEWHQKCSHYFILTASKGCLTSMPLLPSPVAPPIPLLRPVSRALAVRPVSLAPGGGSVEGLGLGLGELSPGAVLLSGGAGRGGRGGEARVLIRDQAGWRCARVEPCSDWGVRVFHTVTAVPGWGCVVYGGRSSPLQPVTSVLRVKYDPPPGLVGPVSPADLCPVRLSARELVCSGGTAPRPRWRHTATSLAYRGRGFLFVFGGRTAEEPALGDAHFLCVEEQRWVEVPVGGAVPEPRHSHTACVYGEGVVVAGGLGRGGVPLGSVLLLRPQETGFCWEELRTQPLLVPRYSHSAHVIGQRLILVGGVWLQAEGVPGVAVVDLATGGSVEYSLDTSAVPWPLMLHSHRSAPLEDGGPELLLVGGGGNCFSFGTHLNPCPVSLDLRPALS